MRLDGVQDRAVGHVIGAAFAARVSCFREKATPGVKSRALAQADTCPSRYFFDFCAGWFVERQEVGAQFLSRGSGGRYSQHRLMASDKMEQRHAAERSFLLRCGAGCFT